MIIQCSKCSSRFLVPDQAIGTKGRSVRCGKCSYTWFQDPTPEMAAQDLPDLNTMIEEINARPKQRPIPKGSNLPALTKSGLPLIHKLSLAILLLITLGITLLVSAPWALGIPSTRGLVLADVGIVRMADKDKHVSFQINGKIANTSAKSMKVPTLRITLVDAEGNSLQFWDFSGDITDIESHKDVPFATGDLDIRFTKAHKFVAEIGSPLELALRRKPAP